MMKKTFHLTRELIDRVDAVEFSYCRDRMNVISKVLGDEHAVAFAERKHIRALAAPEIPSPFLNLHALGLDENKLVWEIA